MDLEAIINFTLDNKEIIGLFAVIATAIGALYRPILDVIKVLPTFTWGLVKFSFQFIWFITWPFRKLVALLYGKFLSNHIDKAFDKMFDWFEKREAVKDVARRPAE